MASDDPAALCNGEARTAGDGLTNPRRFTTMTAASASSTNTERIANPLRDIAEADTHRVRESDIWQRKRSHEACWDIVFEKIHPSSISRAIAMIIKRRTSMMNLGRHFLMLGLSCALFACGAAGNDEQTQEEDIAEYDNLQKSLEGKRAVFVETPAQDFFAAGNSLYWVEVGGGNPLLRSFDDAKKLRTDYTFKVYLTGPGTPNPVDTINYEASGTTVASMNELDGANLYEAGSPEKLLGKLTLPAPPFGQRWWAYSVTGNEVFVVVIDANSGKHVLQKWSPGQGSPTNIFALDDLIAPNVIGEFHDFAVDGTTLIFDEGFRIWMADLGDAKAKWAQNDKHIGSANFYAGGAVYSQGQTFFRYDMASDSREDITDKIKAGYSMNKTFAQVHYPAGNGAWCKYKNKVVYHGSYGIFAYDMDTEQVTPLLLDARDNSVVYRDCAAVDTGTLFVKGLLSKSGAIGADGPTYSLAAANLL